MNADFEAMRVSQGALPIIDVSGLRSPDPAERRAVGRALRATCADKGFFYIRNHGVDPALQARVFDAARRFFHQPLEDKKSYGSSC